jgi:multiple sugar transport system substrate-binding protein
MGRLIKLVATIALATLIPSCGGDQPQGNTKTITIWWAQWDPADGLQDLANQYERETGIKVIVHQIPWSSYQDQVFLNFGNNKTDFDVVIGDSQWIGRGARKGLYVDLTDWLPSAVDMDTVHPRAARYLCEYPPGSGKFFAAPCETDAIGFVYRKDWFEDPAEQAAFLKRFGRALSVPDTWEEFRDVAEFFQRPDKKRYGASLLTGRGYDSLTMGFQMFLWSFGAAWGNTETYQVEGILNTPEAAEGLKFYKSLMAYGPPGATNFDYSKTLETLVNGSTAMVMDYFAFFPGIVKQMENKVGFFKVPRHGDRRAVSLGGQGFSISAKTSAEKQALAKGFIAWFLQQEIQEQWITKDAGFTANTAILQSGAFKSASPYNRAFSESLDLVQDFWNVPEFNDLLSISQQYIGEALDGARTPESALDEIARAHQRIMDEAGLTKGG